MKWTKKVNYIYSYGMEGPEESSSKKEITDKETEKEVSEDEDEDEDEPQNCFMVKKKVLNVGFL